MEINMPKYNVKKDMGDSYSIHEFYMTILNSLPNIVYWVDPECNLQGCNQAFVKLLGIDKLKDFKGTPYEQMKHFAHWDEERCEQFKLDDMEVLFSGEPQHNKDEDEIVDQKGNSLYFQATRVPYYNKSHKLMGLIVTLIDVGATKNLEEPAESHSINHDEVIHEFEDGHLPTVLMIEDNLIAQCVEKALLTSLHCQVDIADSGDNALKLFNPGKYDLVLMDISLEDTSGYVVAKKLRQMEQNTEYHVPIIALTSYDADVVKDDCEQYFMEGAITKPLTSEQADQIIKHYVYHLDIPVRGLKHS